ncbi:MAG: hypothetical protein MK052_04990 [Alphaproteobacteria bacterium]|nr:hypothetical protein [Alphaproteobacteria bacterium]
MKYESEVGSSNDMSNQQTKDSYAEWVNKLKKDTPPEKQFEIFRDFGADAIKNSYHLAEFEPYRDEMEHYVQSVAHAMALKYELENDICLQEKYDAFEEARPTAKSQYMALEDVLMDAPSVLQGQEKKAVVTGLLLGCFEVAKNMVNDALQLAKEEGDLARITEIIQENYQPSTGVASIGFDADKFMQPELRELEATIAPEIKARVLDDLKLGDLSEIKQALVDVIVVRAQRFEVDEKQAKLDREQWDNHHRYDSTVEYQLLHEERFAERKAQDAIETQAIADAEFALWHDLHDKYPNLASDEMAQVYDGLRDGAEEKADTIIFANEEMSVAKNVTLFRLKHDEAYKAEHKKSNTPPKKHVDKVAAETPSSQRRI